MRPLKKLFVMFLQTETESHTDGAHEDVERGEVNAGALKDRESTEGNENVPHDGAERLAHADVEAAARQNIVDKPAGDATCRPDQGRYQRDDGRPLLPSTGARVCWPFGERQLGDGWQSCLGTTSSWSRSPSFAGVMIETPVLVEGVENFLV